MQIRSFRGSGEPARVIALSNAIPHDSALTTAEAQLYLTAHARSRRHGADAGGGQSCGGTWGAAYGGSNTANGNAAIGSNDVTASTFGFAGGMDYHFTPDTLAGFALAGAGTNWGLANALDSGPAMPSRLEPTTSAGLVRLTLLVRCHSAIIGSQPTAMHWATSLPPISLGKATARDWKVVTGMP